MKKTYVYFQPEYVSKFKCNGQACSAACCRKHWTIDFDKATYKKLSHIKPKNEKISEFRKAFQYNDKMQKWLLLPRPCPMLTEDNYCGLQREYGEEYLSITCVSYPRITRQIEDFFERSLSLTCPVVGVLALMNPEPMAFEQTEITRTFHDKFGKISILSPLPWIPKDLIPHIVTIQTAAISIMQERSLILDQRLIVLGFFFDKLEELLIAGKFDEIPDLTAFYMSEKFLTETAPQLVKKIKFNPVEHMRIMLGTFETLYGKVAENANTENPYIDSLIKTFEMIPDEKGEIPLDRLVEKYKSYNMLRQNFLETYSTVFENYLVNEFFLNLYPFHFGASTIQNYAAFLTSYKMLELIAMSFMKQDPLSILIANKMQLLPVLMHFANQLDHNHDYFGKIVDYIKDKQDMTEILQSLLQG